MKQEVRPMNVDPRYRANVFLRKNHKPHIFLFDGRWRAATAGCTLHQSVCAEWFAWITLRKNYGADGR
jgi:hypothetical protein